MTKRDDLIKQIPEPTPYTHDPELSYQTNLLRFVTEQLADLQALARWQIAYQIAKDEEGIGW